MENLQPIATTPSPTADRLRPAPEPRAERTAPAPPERETAPAPPPVSREEMEEMVARLQEALAESRPQDWRVGIHEEDGTGSLVIEIKDTEGEVIKQIPPEKVLNLRKRLDDLAGVVVDRTT